MADVDNATGAPEATNGLDDENKAFNNFMSVLDLEDEESAPPADTESPAKAAQTDDGPAPAAATEEQPSDDGEPAQEAESEVEDEPAKEAHGNMKTRLRDGTEVTVADLKKQIDEAKEIKAKFSDWSTAQAQIQQESVRIKQRFELAEQAINDAAAIVQSFMPKPPDEALRAHDPIEYFLQKDAYEAQKGRLAGIFQHQQRIRQEMSAKMQAEAAEREKAAADYTRQQTAKLLELMPEMKDPVSRSKFGSELLTYGQKYYGFSEKELGNISDARLLPMARDAFAWRAYQASQKSAKAAPAPVAAATKQVSATKSPVREPGRRVTSEERDAAATTAKFKRLASSGRLDDAAAMFEDLL